MKIALREHFVNYIQVVFLRLAYAVGSALCMPRAYRPDIFLDGYAGGRGRLPARLVHRYRGSGRPARPSPLRPT